jgi:hypothetical protein
MRFVLIAVILFTSRMCLADEVIVIGKGLWPCQMFKLKGGEKLTSILEQGQGPLLCYTMRAMEQYDAIDTDPDELSVIVEKKEKHLVESGKCQVFIPDVSYRVASDKHHVLTLIREDMPKTPLYYRKPVEMAHPCD